MHTIIKKGSQSLTLKIAQSSEEECERSFICSAGRITEHINFSAKLHVNVVDIR